MTCHPDDLVFGAATKLHQPRRSKVRRLSRKVSFPRTQNHPNCCTCHEIQLLTRLRHASKTRDCGARVFSNSFDTFQARQDEPTKRTPGPTKRTPGPTKRTPAQTLSHACQAGHLKTTTPGTQIPMARQPERTALQTLHLRSEIARNAPKDTIHARAQTIQRFKTQLFPHADSRGRFRTLADTCGRFPPHASRPANRTLLGHDPPP